MTRLATATAFLLAIAATPAHATGSGACRGTIQPRLRVDLVIGRLAGPVIAQARLTDGRDTVQSGARGVLIAQSWLDEHTLNLDLTDANGSSYVARLRTWRRGIRGEFIGSLRYAGRTYQMRCRIEEEG